MLETEMKGSHHHEKHVQWAQTHIKLRQSDKGSSSPMRAGSVLIILMDVSRSGRELDNALLMITSWKGFHGEVKAL